MKGHDAAERPSTDGLFDPALVAMEDDGLPDSKELEGMVDIKIRPAVGVFGVVQIGVPGVRAGVCIHAMGPCELRVRRERMGELVLESCEHHVVGRPTT